MREKAREMERKNRAETEIRKSERERERETEKERQTDRQRAANTRKHTCLERRRWGGGKGEGRRGRTGTKKQNKKSKNTF